MNRQIKATLYYLFTDVQYAFTIFWIILIAIVGFLISVQLIFSSNETEITFSISAPIIIFASVIGYLTVKNGIPYIIRLGATRKCIFVSVMIYFICLTLFNAILAFIINQLMATILGKEIIQGIIFTNEHGEFKLTHLAQFLGSSPFYEIIVDTTLALLSAIMMFIVGLIFYRFHLIGGLTFLGISFIVFILSAANGLLEKLVIYIFENYNLALYGHILLFSLLIYLLSYLLLKRLPV